MIGRERKRERKYIVGREAEIRDREREREIGKKKVRGQKE